MPMYRAVAFELHPLRGTPWRNSKRTCWIGCATPMAVEPRVRLGLDQALRQSVCRGVGPIRANPFPGYLNQEPAEQANLYGLPAKRSGSHRRRLLFASWSARCSRGHAPRLERTAKVEPRRRFHHEGRAGPIEATPHGRVGGHQQNPAEPCSVGPGRLIHSQLSYSLKETQHASNHSLRCRSACSFGLWWRKHRVQCPRPGRRGNTQNQAAGRELSRVFFGRRCRCHGLAATATHRCP